MADLEILKAKAEAVKRLRNAIRLELAIVGDRLIMDQKDELDSLMDREIANGGLPALDRAVNVYIWQFAREFEAIVKGAVQQLPTPGAIPEKKGKRIASAK